MARASVSDAPWTPSSGGVPGMSRREETQEERLGILPEELEEVSGEREVWVSLLRQLPLRPGPGQRRRRWMDGWKKILPLYVIKCFFLASNEAERTFFFVLCANCIKFRRLRTLE